MSEALEINGEQFVPSKVAAKQVGYTGDYVARLAREEKILARKIGKTWYVSLDSLQTFAERAKSEKESWRQELSEERKRELNGGTQNISTASNSKTEHRFQRTESPEHRAAGRSLALAQTFTVLLLGVAFGTGGYFVSTERISAVAQVPDTSFFKELALSFYDLFSTEIVVENTSDETTTVPVEETRTQVNGVDEREQSIPTRGNETVSEAAQNGKPDNTQAEFTALVENAFSDEVDVEMNEEEPNIAMVFPIFEERREQPYEFVLLPISGSETVDADFYRSLMSRVATTSTENNISESK